MELSPDLLDAYLQILEEHGVKEFQCQFFHVKWGQRIQPETRIMQPAPVAAGDKRRSLWEEPSLWPDGRPPEFPKSEK